MTAAVLLIGTAMIVYTVRGGSAAVIWTDVVQMFVYVAGRRRGVRIASRADPRRMAEVVRTERRQTSFGSSICRGTSRGRTRSGPESSEVRPDLSTHGIDQSLVQRLLSARSRARPRSGSWRAASWYSRSSCCFLSSA